MKNLKNILAIITTITATQLYGYEISFFNTTSIPVAIAIQYAHGQVEPLYKEYIKPNAMRSFVPGKNEIPDIKWSFCLQNIYMAKNPTMAERAYYFAKTHWEKTSITWQDIPLPTEEKPKRAPKKGLSSASPQRVLVKKRKPKREDFSLCRDRHFEIREDVNGKLIIVGSTAEKY